MIEFQYYKFQEKMYCFVDINSEIKKKFILPDCNDFLSKDKNIMIEIESLKDFFNNEKIEIINNNSFKIDSLEFIYNSDEKLNILFKYKDKSFLLKSFKPFWGRTTKNKCWVGLVK